MHGLRQMPAPMAHGFDGWWLKRRSALFAALLATTLVGSACGGSAAVEDPDAVGEDSEGEGLELPYDSIASVNQSVVKRQSIGNCWLYATASWVESMHLSSTGEQLNLSESYWTYFHWFDEITTGQVFNNEISTGGGYDVASGILLRYGVMNEADFIPEEANSEMSARQKSALDAINLSLKSGALKDPAARRNKKLVRQELDKAWQLKDSVKAQLDKLFLPDMSRNLAMKSGTKWLISSTTGTKITRATSFKAAYSTGPGKKPLKKNLADAIATWSEFRYPTSSTGTARREFQKRVQRALHDGQPVIMSWFVDFNALDGQGRFFAPPTTPGHQGGHMTVLHDYEIENVPGYGTLLAGKTETRKEALAAALSDQARIVFVRVKNSWGSFRPDRAFALPGYHDLYMKYLDGPVKQCSEGSTTSCWNTTPWQDVVLPPGY